MPEIVHYGGGSAIGLSNVGSDQLATPYILVADQFQNLGPLVPNPNPDIPPVPQVNFADTDIHITGGTFNAQKILVQGGASSDMFSITDSLHVCKFIQFPQDNPPLTYLAQGCVDPNGITYYMGTMGEGGAGGPVIVQHIVPTNTNSFIPFDYERYSIYAMGATTQSLYLGVYDSQGIGENWYVFILEINAFTITGQLDSGEYTLENLQDIKFDNAGGIYVSSYTTIYYFANESSTPTVIDPGRQITSIAIDSRNHIYAIDYYHGNAFCITTNVTYEPPSDIDVFYFFPYGIAVDSNFEVYLNFNCADKIVKYLENGSYFYTINLQYHSGASYIDIKGFDDLYVFTGGFGSRIGVYVYKSVIEIGKVTRLIGDEFYGDGGTLSNVHVPADSVIQPFSNLKVLGTTITTNLGIGTPSPYYPLHLLLTTDTAQGAYPVSSFGSTSGWDIQFFSDDTLRNAPPYILGQSSYGLGLAGVTGLIKFYDYNGGQGLIELMRIDSGGYVGIGTSTPGFQLDVNGSINAFSYYGDGGFLSNVNSFVQPLANLVVSNTLTVTNVSASGNVSALRFIGDGSALSGIQISQPLANLVVSNSVTTTNIFTTGYVGIGTTSPAAMLDVVTSTTSEVGSLIAQLGTSVYPRIKFYDETLENSIPPYIHGESGLGLGLAGGGPIKFYPDGNPGPLSLLVSSGGTQSFFQLSAQQYGAGAEFARLIETYDYHNYIYSSDGSISQTYTLVVSDNYGSYDPSNVPSCMVNFSRVENNNENNFHLEFVNSSQNNLDHGDYGVGMGFLDNGLMGASTGQSPFILSTHTLDDNATAFSNAMDTSNVAISIAMNGTKYVGINTVAPAYTLDVNGTVKAGSLTTTNVYANVLQLVSGTDMGSAVLTFNDSPYTTALSSDGSTLVLGYIDRIDIFDIASQTTWKDEDHGGSWSVSINSDATILVSGDPVNARVNIYRKSGGVWSWRTYVEGTGNFGFCVSLSASGYYFLVSEVSSSAAGSGGSDTGIAYRYYNEDADTWTPGVNFDNFDAPICSVAISGDGNTCVFGAPGYNVVTGRIYITTDLGTTYTTFDGDNQYDWFGYYVSVNYAGTRIVANSSSDNNNNYIKIFTLE